VCKKILFAILLGVIDGSTMLHIGAPVASIVAKMSFARRSPARERKRIPGR
jgi:hypothetical protein